MRIFGAGPPPAGCAPPAGTGRAYPPNPPSRSPRIAESCAVLSAVGCRAARGRGPSARASPATPPPPLSPALCTAPRFVPTILLSAATETSIATMPSARRVRLVLVFTSRPSMQNLVRECHRDQRGERDGSPGYDPRGSTLRDAWEFHARLAQVQQTGAAVSAIRCCGMRRCPSPPPSPRARDWDSRSVARSSKRTADG